MIASVDRLFVHPAQHDPLGVRRQESATSGSNGADIRRLLALLKEALVCMRLLRERTASQFVNSGGQSADVDRRYDDILRQIADFRAEIARRPQHHAATKPSPIRITP